MILFLVFYAPMACATAYKDAYTAWVDGMTMAERRELDRMGVGSPDEGGTAKRGLEYEDGIAAQADSDGQREQSSRADALTVVLARIRASDNPALMLDVFCRALWVPGMAELSLDDVARRHGVSRQRVHAIQTDLVGTLNLPPPPRLRRRAAPRPPARPADAARRSLDKYRQWFNATDAALPYTRRPEQERRAVMAELRWFAEKWAALGGGRGLA